MHIILTYILNLIDYLFTLYWVRKFGIETELNPIGRWMFEQNVAWLFKIVIIGGLLGAVGWHIHRHPEDAYLAWIPLIWYGAVVAYHIAIFLYIRR